MGQDSTYQRFFGIFELFRMPGLLLFKLRRQINLKGSSLIYTYTYVCLYISVCIIYTHTKILSCVSGGCGVGGGGGVLQAANIIQGHLEAEARRRGNTHMAKAVSKKTLGRGFKA